MWLLPSRGRPHLVQRLMPHFQTPGILLLDDDDHHRYEGVALADGWKRVVRRRMHLSAKVNAGFDGSPDEPWYGVINDDHLPVTKDWDLLLTNPVRGMAWPHDNYAGRISVLVMSGDLVRKLGWFACPDIRHFYLDDVHELIAECLGYRGSPEIVVSHEHVNAGRMPVDQTYRERPNNAEDRAAFVRWCRDKWPEVRERLCG